ncbi:MAG: LytR family transcriptional regulator [Armatimonadetes bacterium]|nr:MAG: LytR family transcriptional regulator [Armatimonadota bacterium]
MPTNSASERTDIAGPSDQSHSRYRPWIAAGLCILVPGAGHLYLRRYRRAAIWAAPIAIVVAAYFVLDIDKFDLVGAALSKPALWTLFATNVLAAIWRLASAVDAYAIAQASDGTWLRPAAVVGGIILATIVVVPHVFVATTTVDAMRLLDIVFAGDNDPPDTPVIPIGSDADIVADPVVTVYEGDTRTQTIVRSRIFEEGFGEQDAIDALEAELEARQNEGSESPLLSFEERVGTDRITILLAGGDGGPGRGGLRTDTMMVATINPQTGKAALFGFPRNLGHMPLPSGWGAAFESLERKILASTTPVPEEPTDDTTSTTIDSFSSCRCFPEQLNALYPFTRRWTKTYPDEADPGMAALRDVLSNATGLRIDYYALVDMAAFVDLVEAIGGVDVYVQEPLQAEVSPPREGDPWATVDVDVGWHRLDGPEALAYVRARKGSSDYARMQRQRCMLRAVAAKSTPLTLLRGLGGIVDALDGSMVTDLPVTFASDMLEMTARLDFSDIETVGFNPGYYAPAWDVLGHPIPDLQRIRGKVASVIRDQDAGIQADADGESSECDG